MRAQLYSIQEVPAGQVSIMARPRGGDWLLDEIKAIREAGVDVLISLLTQENTSRCIVGRGLAGPLSWLQVFSYSPDILQKRHLIS